MEQRLPPLPVTINSSSGAHLTLPPCSFPAFEQRVSTFFQVQPPLRLLYQSEGQTHMVTSAASYAAALQLCPPEGLQLTLEIETSRVATVQSGELLCYTINRKQIRRLALPFLNESCRVVLYLNKGLFVTGCGEDQQHCYEVTSAWQLLPRASLPAPRQSHTLGLLGDTVYLACGVEGVHVSNTVLALRGTWFNVEAAGVKRTSASSVVMQGDWYIAGGWQKRGPEWKELSTVERFREGRWTVLPVKLPAPGHHLGLVWLRDTTLLVCGRCTYELDVETGQSRECASAGWSAFNSNGEFVQGVAYLLGEGQVWAYNLQNNTWTSVYQAT